MKVLFYTTSFNRSPVTDFIDKQEKNDQSTILAVLEAIQFDGLNAKGAQFRQLKGKLWEIKIRTVSGGYRFLYVTINQDKMLILHGFKKKTPKTPEKEIKTALQRLKEYI